MRRQRAHLSTACALALPSLVLCGPSRAITQSGQGTYDEAVDPPEPGDSGDREPSVDDAALRIPCLEDLSADGQVRKGVQQRPFLKRHRFEVAALGGLFASDALSSTYTFGGAASFFVAEDFALEFMFTHAPVRFALEEPFSAFDRDLRFQAGRANQAVASLVFVPLQAKVKASEESILPADLYVAAGAGRTFHDSVQGLTWEAGVGMHLYFGRFVGLRLDVRDYVLPQEVLGQARITHNLLVSLGLGAWVL